MIISARVRSPFFRKCLYLTAFAAALLPQTFMLPVCGQSKDGIHELKGKILDEQGNPVPKSKIVLHLEDDGSSYHGQSDGKGNFKLEFPKCHFISFEVNPPKKSGLARARFQHLSGEATKHFMVRLHHGFLVQGRVIGHNAGLKGVKVHVTDPHDKDVHASGTAITGGGGQFSMRLTPGNKLFEIVNDRFSDLSGSTQQHVTITGDTSLPDLVVPPLKHSN